MPITKEDVIAAYRLFLGREASAEEIQTKLLNVSDINLLRRIFLNSAEFQAQLRIKRDSSDVTPETIIHIHIPKTAGTSLNAILGGEYPPEAIMTISIDKINQLLERSPEDRRNIKFLYGHLEHGIDHYFPQSTVYVAVLRDPGQRLYSFFRYIMRAENHRLHKDLVSRKQGFGTFLRSALDDPGLRLEIDNGQTRRIAGCTLTQDIDYRKMFAKAMQNMTMPNMIIGTTERFEVLLYTLWTRRLLRNTANIFENVGGEGNMSYQEALESLDSAERSLFDSYCYWDRLLHQAAELLVDGTQCDIPEATVEMA